MSELHTIRIIWIGSNRIQSDILGSIGIYWYIYYICQKYTIRIYCVCLNSHSSPHSHTIWMWPCVLPYVKWSCEVGQKSKFCRIYKQIMNLTCDQELISVKIIQLSQMKMTTNQIHEWIQIVNERCENNNAIGKVGYTVRNIFIVFHWLTIWQT